MSGGRGANFGTKHDIVFSSDFLRLAFMNVVILVYLFSMMLGDLGEEYIQISVTSPHKVGDGIGSYMAYTIKTNTNLSYFKVRLIARLIYN